MAEVLAEQDDERLTEEPLNQQELLQVRWRTRPAEASGSRDESTPGGAKKMLEVSDDEGSCRNGGLLRRSRIPCTSSCGRWRRLTRYETLRIASDQTLAELGLTRNDVPRAAYRMLTGGW